jgi:hypothetical protein
VSQTTDPTDPRLTRGIDEEPRPQAEAYLVLSAEERAKGFVRPVRSAYVHLGAAGPKHPLRDLTDEQRERYSVAGYVKFEAYPESDAAATGRYWTQAQLDRVGKGCHSVTTMGEALAETYARDPRFYGATYCVRCQKHLAVGEFTWDADGTVVGS